MSTVFLSGPCVLSFFLRREQKTYQDRRLSKLVSKKSCVHVIWFSFRQWLFYIGSTFFQVQSLLIFGVFVWKKTIFKKTFPIPKSFRGKARTFEIKAFSRHQLFLFFSIFFFSKLLFFVFVARKFPFEHSFLAKAREQKWISFFFASPSKTVSKNWYENRNFFLSKLGWGKTGKKQNNFFEVVFLPGFQSKFLLLGKTMRPYR